MDYIDYTPLDGAVGGAHVIYDRTLCTLSHTCTVAIEI